MPVLMLKKYTHLECFQELMKTQAFLKLIYGAMQFTHKLIGKCNKWHNFNKKQNYSGPENKMLSMLD